MTDKIIKGIDGKKYIIQKGCCKDCFFIGKDGICDLDRFQKEFPKYTCCGSIVDIVFTGFILKEKK